MLNIICNVTTADGKCLRYTVKIKEDSTVQCLVDRMQQRFNEPLSKIQRNDRIQGPANILFFDEVIEAGDEFYFNFDRANSETPVNNNMDYDVPTFDQMPQLISNQPLPPSSEGSPSSQITQQTKNEICQEMPSLTNGEQQMVMQLTPALSQVTVDNVIHGSSKAEQIVEKLKRGENIEPGERQLLVRIAGRWLMNSCYIQMKPTSAERAFFTKKFFGSLPNFKYDIKDFHNSQSRGFLDVFIYNERDRKTRNGELSRTNLNPDNTLRNLKRKYNRINEKDEHNPFVNLVVPPDSITSLIRLELDEQMFESRYIDIITKEFNNSDIGSNLALKWEESVAPRILNYVKKINQDFYQNKIGNQELTPKFVSDSALEMVPLLVKRLHREHSSTKITYLIKKIETLDDQGILNHQRNCLDPGPFIASDNVNSSYMLIVSDKILAIEQSSSVALAKLIKAYFVYNFGNHLSLLRKAMITLLLLCFGLSKSSSSSFKEVCQCIMNY